MKSLSCEISSVAGLSTEIGLVNYEKIKCKQQLDLSMKYKCAYKAACLLVSFCIKKVIFLALNQFLVKHSG